MGLSAYFDSRFKFRVHMVELSLISLVILLSIIRVSMAPPQRAHIMGIAIGIKSILFISYQVLTEHRLRFQKWANPKTNFILNCVDIPFWAAVMYLLLSANATSCTGGACGVSWTMAVLAIVLLIITFWVAIVTYMEYRYRGRKVVYDANHV